jgi:hypothetical protein
MDPIRPDGSGATDGAGTPIDMPLLDVAEINGAGARSAIAGGWSDGSILRTTAGGNPNFYRQPSLPPSIHDDPNRDFWFANSSVSKLANISTDRSSVFAIWITVGFFEIDDDGRLGAEVGSDTGDTKRHRGFYIFGRSIPVGFEPGKNHNVERGILVQSIIE